MPDALGRVIRTNQPDGTHTERTYDDAGRVLTETDELGRAESFEHDAQGRLTAVELPAVIDPDDDQGRPPGVYWRG